MKIDRLIGILSILLQKEMTTAPELAEHFEVSGRTINRDIEAHCKAGIPIQTSQGYGGGISIMDGYRMDRTFLTSKDMQMILAGLRSLDSESEDGRLLFTADYTDMDNLITWLMTFGAKVLEPVEARNIIRRNAEKTLKIYMED